MNCIKLYTNLFFMLQSVSLLATTREAVLLKAPPAFSYNNDELPEYVKHTFSMTWSFGKASHIRFVYNNHQTCMNVQFEEDLPDDVRASCKK